MPKKITARRSAERIARAALLNKIDLLIAVLENIYWNGFKEHRGVRYRIKRSTLRVLGDFQRLELGTMKEIVEWVRKHGFILYPLDKGDYARARVWIFDKLDLVQIPLADEAAISNAAERAEAVSE